MQIVPQRHRADCSVATLATILGLSYEEVLVAFRHNVFFDGATNSQMRAAARRLGRELRWAKKFDIETESGLLVIKLPTELLPAGIGQHMVVLKEGQILDLADTTLWDADIYLSAHKASAVELITIKEGGRELRREG